MPVIVTDYLRDFIILYSVKIAAFRSRCWGRGECVWSQRPKGVGGRGKAGKLGT